MSESTSSQSNEPAPAVKKPLRALLVEGSEVEAGLLVRHLEQHYQLQSRRVQDATAMREALQHGPWDVVLCDNGLSGFGVVSAMAIVGERQLDPAFLVVSGASGEDLAVEAMQAGAHDYILKDKLARLVPAIEREVRQAQARRDRARTQRKAAWRGRGGLHERGGHRHGPGWNHHQLDAGAEKLYGYTAEEAIGKAIEWSRLRLCTRKPPDAGGKARGKAVGRVRNHGAVAAGWQPGGVLFDIPAVKDVSAGHCAAIPAATSPNANKPKKNARK